MSQWPRYEVFVKASERGPFRNVGSVHAVDTEMALQNARDVFGRRPPVVAMWVAPESSIVSANSEQVGALNDPGRAKEGRGVKFLIFTKDSHRGSMTFVEERGSVRAPDALAALAKAARTFTSSPAYTWWAVAESSISSTDSDDISSMFHPAATKRYRSPRAYHTHSMMRQIIEASTDGIEVGNE